MPIELMLSLAESPLPKIIEDTAEIDKLRILVAAQLVTAHLPDVHSPIQKAEVTSVTPQGRAALEKASLDLNLPDLRTEV